MKRARSQGEEKFYLSSFNNKTKEEVPLFPLKDLPHDEWLPIINAKIVNTKFGERILLRLYLPESCGDGYMDSFLPEKYMSVLNAQNIKDFNSQKFVLKCIQCEEKPTKIYMEYSDRI